MLIPPNIALIRMAEKYPLLIPRFNFGTLSRAMLVYRVMPGLVI